RVLHVPDLRSNLFSVLFLTKNKGFDVHIFGDFMQFRLRGSLLFSARVSEDLTATLMGRVIPTQRIEVAGAVSTLSVDKALWHRRFAHLNHRSVEELI
ncbi:hypothetical protein SCHPADRAFT_792649, partial [Schizopora paradoxa]